MKFELERAAGALQRTCEATPDGIAGRKPRAHIGIERYLRQNILELTAERLDRRRTEKPFGGRAPVSHRGLPIEAYDRIVARIEKRGELRGREARNRRRLPADWRQSESGVASSEGVAKAPYAHEEDQQREAHSHHNSELSYTLREWLNGLATHFCMMEYVE